MFLIPRQDHILASSQLKSSDSNLVKHNITELLADEKLWLILNSSNTTIQTVFWFNNDTPELAKLVLLLQQLTNNCTSV